MQSCHKFTRPTSLAKAFTLVEMLVVISIIAVLTSLVSVAAYQGLQAAKRSRTQTEITNMASALEQFKLKFGGQYPPSYLDQRDLNSRALMIRFLAKAFPRCNPNNEVWFIPWTNNTPTQGHEMFYPFLASDGVTIQLWDVENNNSQPITAGTPMTPSQALVFWLTSVTKDPVHPLSGATTDRQSLFDFETARITRQSSDPAWSLVTLTGAPAAASLQITSTSVPKYNPGVYSPRDGNQMPYTYFEARCYLFHALFAAGSPVPSAVPYLLQTAPWDTNGNGQLDAGPPPTSPTPANTPEITTDTSNDLLSAINDSNTSFSQYTKLCVNPNSFQIISAGPDNDFGTVNTTSTAGSQPGLPAPPTAVSYNTGYGTTPTAQNFLIYYKSYPDGQGYNATTNADDDNLTNFTEKSLGQAKP